jgi:hypothetical protein
MGAIKTIAFCIFICFIPMMELRKITVNDTYTAQNLVNILKQQYLLHYINLQCFRRYLFRDSEKLWFFNSERAAFQEGILLSTWSISKAVGP